MICSSVRCCFRTANTPSATRPCAEDEPVGVGEQGALELVELIRHLPVLERFDLLLREAEGAATLAVLREHELTCQRPAGAGLAELAQLRGDLAIGAGVESEARHRVLEHVGRVGPHRPPVTRRAGGGAGLGDGVAVAEQDAIHPANDLGIVIGLRDLRETRHTQIVCNLRHCAAKQGDLLDPTRGTVCNSAMARARGRPRRRARQRLTARRIAFAA